jgi:dipeptidyl-peptidase-4
VLDVATRKERRLSQGGSKTRSFGLAEFIAEEEMGRHEGHWWSPDESRLLVFEVDERPVAVKLRAQIHADHTTLVEQRYPAAGEANAKVTAHLFDRAGGRRTTLATPKEDGYLARAGFFADGVPWIQWQSRDQRRLTLFEADARGALRPLVEEQDAAWVTLHDDLRSLADGRFLWTSERSGRRQIELVERKTGARSVLTDEPEPVDAIVGADVERGLAYYLVRRARALERHLYAVPLAGGPSHPVASEAGWHSVTFARSGTRFVDVFSSWGRPPVTTLREPSGATLMLDDNPTPELAALPAPKPEWRELQAEDGTVMNGLLLPPLVIEKGWRYPVIAWIYGGPTGQMVANRWAKSYPLFLHLAQRGYGVFLLDNRGTGGRGREIDRAHFRRFGEVEVKDLFAAIEQLKSVSWIDTKRLGIWGWSYGGYLAARAVLDTATPFSAAVAIAPVSDWTLYDTHYTERYLGPPEGGKAGPYEKASLLTRAGLLQRQLLIVHGTADDNVLFEHSLRLIEALQQKNRSFDVMIYPGKAHGIAGRAAQRHVFETAFRYFDRNLGR